MIKISIIPDTNILLSHLPLIEELFHEKLPVTFTINFAKTVIKELESMKTSKKQARDAIRFIETVEHEIKIELEGRIDERKVEVIFDTKSTVEPENSDDTILNYCCKVENPVFLTSDKAFYLKCLTHNIKAVNIPARMTIEKLKHSICEAYGIKEDSISDSLDYIQKVNNKLTRLIEPVILSILYKELGEGASLVISKCFDLVSYLELVIKQFFLFKQYMPAKSPDLLKEFIEAMKHKNPKLVKEMIHPICMLFRLAAPSDIA